MDTKICCRCGEEFPKSTKYFFTNKSKPDGLRYECKECSKKHVEKNKEKISEQRKAYRDRNKERLLEEKRAIYRRPSVKLRVKKAQMRLKYGVSEEVVQELMDIQRGCCAICQDSLVSPESKRSFMIDHNHDTGEVRGLLCLSCNSAIGLLKEDEEVLTSAIRYLQKYNE